MKLMSIAASVAVASLSIVLAHCQSSGCSTTGTASCTNTSVVANLCCFESPGGLMLQTQFWDTNPSTGPVDSFTIHGLSSDNCDSTFSENCDPSRAYTNMASLLESNGASNTLDFMSKFWVDINGQNEHFWENVWATHGTCMSTLNPSCLPKGSARGAEAVAYFRTVITWYFNLKGSMIDGTFVPIDAPKTGSCPSTGIKYPPKAK
ncbi:ribonuclease T2-like [Linnemannia hyalina]|uniref:Ribonuclease T2-like n=1 Tax=Linnemannia hyalina TaxID=64524 RepID=A0A9P7XKD3_9FUNG|nr:ribonuclease T2-like [Linnemannia hyalina]